MISSNLSGGETWERQQRDALRENRAGNAAEETRGIFFLSSFFFLFLFLFFFFFFVCVKTANNRNLSDLYGWDTVFKCNNVGAGLDGALCYPP